MCGMSSADTSPVTMTPARERLRSDLLGWGRPRPVVDVGAVRRLRAGLEAELTGLREAVEAAAMSARSGRLMVTKSRLAHLSCDGLAIDAEPFSYSWASVRGILTHALVEQDWQERRCRDIADITLTVWESESSRSPGDPSSLSAWMNALPGDEAASMREQLAGLLAAFREVWPLLNEDEVIAQVERAYGFDAAGGKVSLFGRPDLVLESPRTDEHARTLVVDLKTGRPRPEHDRADARFYALLVTLVTGQPPFRWATYYVQEGRYDVEDLRIASLEATVRRVIGGVRQQVRIAGQPSGATDGLTIRGGGWCRFCTRRTWCPAAREAGWETE